MRLHKVLAGYLASRPSADHRGGFGVNTKNRFWAAHFWTRFCSSECGVSCGLSYIGGLGVRDRGGVGFNRRAKAVADRYPHIEELAREAAAVSRGALPLRAAYLSRSPCYWFISCSRHRTAPIAGTTPTPEGSEGMASGQPTRRAVSRVEKQMGSDCSAPR